MRVQTIGAVLVCAVIGFAHAQERVPTREWRYFGGDKAFTRYSPLNQIHPRQRQESADRLAPSRRQRRADTGRSRSQGHQLPAEPMQ